MTAAGMWRSAFGNRWARIGMALASGLLAGLVHPPFGFWAGLIGYPLLMLLAMRSTRTRGAFWMGWLFGFAYFFIGCWWVAEAFFVNPAQAWMAPFAASLLPAGIGLFTGAACAAFRALRAQGQTAVLQFVVLFALFEWLRGHILTGFPWNPVGAGWEAGSAPSQLAAVVGVYGLGLITLLAACAFAPLLERGVRRSAVVWAAAGAVIFVGVWGYGAYRLSTTTVEASETSVRIVQANVPQANKWSEEAYQGILNRYLELTSAPSERMPDVVVWPESALPDLANNVFAREDALRISEVLQPGQTLLAGLSRAEPMTGEGWSYYNSLFAMRKLPQGGMQIDGVYDKHRLVPFGEYLPLGDLLGAIGVRSLVQMPEDLSSGPAPSPLALPTLPTVQPLICYESLFPGFTDMRGTVRPQWIANVSNDAWFGQTSGPVQHLNLASYRAIETGLPMVRATPTGISAVIDPVGRIVEGSRLDTGVSGFRDVWLPMPLKGTLYGLMGDRIFWILMIALGTAVLFVRTKNGSFHLPQKRLSPEAVA